MSNIKLCFPTFLSIVLFLKSFKNTNVLNDTRENYTLNFCKSFRFTRPRIYNAHFSKRVVISLALL